MKVEKTERGAYVTTETIDVSMTPEEAVELADELRGALMWLEKDGRIPVGSDAGKLRLLLLDLERVRWT